ncbi:hypothetical protein BH11PLA1_BH11PLA1_02890 [soil metagenome]
MARRSPPLRTILCFTLAACALALPGCNAFREWFTSGGSITAASVTTGVYLAPELPTAVFIPLDEQTADVYLTDLPITRLIDEADTLASATGSIVHIHVFLVPDAGKTPLDASAVNVAVRHAVYAGGAIGLYCGGGFLSTSEPEGSAYAAVLRDSSLRLSVATANFEDRLGSTIITGAFSATRDEKLCRILAARLADLAFGLPRVTAAE